MLRYQQSFTTSEPQLGRYTKLHHQNSFSGFILAHVLGSSSLVGNSHQA